MSCSTRGAPGQTCSLSLGRAGSRGCCRRRRAPRNSSTGSSESPAVNGSASIRWRAHPRRAGPRRRSPTVDPITLLSSGRPAALGRAAPGRAADRVAGSPPTPPMLALDLDLSPRQEEILAMLGQGLSNRDIADEVFLGVETVRTYVRQVYQKLGVKNRTQAAVRARALGLEPIGERRRETT